MEPDSSSAIGNVSPLVKALAERNWNQIKEHIEAGQDVFCVDEDGNSLLHILATKYTKDETNDSIPYLLLEKGVNINAKNKTGDTALHIAANQGLHNLCHIFLQYRQQDIPIVEIDAKNNKCKTPLHKAAKGGYNHVVQLLLNHGANPGLQDNTCNRFLPLHYAADGGHYECCRMLACGYTGHNSVIPPTMLATKKGHHRCITEMETLKDILDLNYQDGEGNTALHFAAFCGFESTMTTLLDMGANPNIQNRFGNTPLMQAVKKCREGCVKILKDAGADVTINNNDQKNVLNIAVIANAKKCMEYLLKEPKLREKIVEEDKDGMTALSIAIKRKRTTCAKLLLEASPRLPLIKLKDSLHFTAKNDMLELLKQLLSKGVQVNDKNVKGRTALHEAAEHGSREACLLLLHKGVDKNAKDHEGKTAMHLCADQGYASVLQLLVKSGAGKKILDEKKLTVLHLAAAKGHLNCCQILVSSDKNLMKCKDVAGKYAYSYALENNHLEVFQFIIENLPYKDLNHIPMDLQNDIHDYTHKALKQKNKKFLQILIGSKWWRIGFRTRVSRYCEGKVELPWCSNLRDLIRHFPSLSAEVFEKLCLTKRSKPQYYDFTLLEDNYYLENEPSPFDKDSKLVPDAQELECGMLEWCCDHPISIIIQLQRADLLQHRVVQAWLSHKWHSYTKLLYYSYLALMILFVVVFSIFIVCVKNWKHIEKFYSMTEEEFCNREQHCSVNGHDTRYTLDWSTTTSHILHFLVLVLLIVLAVLGLNVMKTMKKRCLNKSSAFIRVVCFLFCVAALLPTSICELKYGIKSEAIWQIGVIGVLLAWLLLIHDINRLPQFSIMAVPTWEFITQFLKGAVIMLMVVLMFALVFHVLLGTQPEFFTLGQSTMKILVWLYGDLGYNDTFLKHLDYPILTNILFVAFIFTAGSLFVQLIKSPSFDEKALHYLRDARWAVLIFDIDICLPWPSIRKRHVVSMKETKDELKKFVCYKMPSHTEIKMGSDEDEKKSSPFHDIMEEITNLREEQNKLKEIMTQLSYKINDHLLKGQQN